MRAGLESLTLIERLLCRRLIVRQLRFSPRVGRDLRDFGPTGLIKISSARALQLFLFVLVVVGVVLSFAQVSPPAVITVWTLILLMGAFVLVRCFTAAREAKRYRRSTGDLRS
jgi:Flp pilus assembly protein TadB